MREGPKLQRAVPSRAALSAADRIRAEARCDSVEWLVEAAAEVLPGNVCVPAWPQFRIDEMVRDPVCGDLQSYVASFSGSVFGLERAHQMLLLLRAEEARWRENPHCRATREFRVVVMLELMDKARNHAGWLDCETLEFRIFPHLASVDGKVVGA